MDVGVHDFDTARWLLGRDPTAVFTQVHAPVYHDTDVDNAYITIALGDAAATVHLSRTSTYGMDIRCEVVGPGGSIQIAEPAVGGGMVVLTADSSNAFPADCRGRFHDAYQAQMDAFGRACRGEETAGATLEDDRWAVATAVAARRQRRPRRADSTSARPGTGTRRPPYRPRRVSIFYLLPTSSVSPRRGFLLGS